MNDLHFAFIAGIDHYPHISDLQGPSRDAAAFRDWLRAPDGGGLPEQNVTNLLPIGKDRPTRSDLVSGLAETNDKISAAIGDDPDRFGRSRLYLFLAGHGIAPSGGDAALLPANASSKLFGENFEVSKIRNWYTECGIVRELVIFCDFCRNRITLAESGPLGFTKCGSARGKVEQFTGYATAYDRPAYEQIEETIPPDDRRGFFSKALLEGLNGAGAGGGEVTSDTLEAYVRQRVRELTGNLIPEQDARFPRDLAAPLTFGRPRREVPRTVTIETGRVRDPVRLLDHRHRPVADWSPGGSTPWTVSVPDGLYAVAPAGTGAMLKLFKVIGQDCDVVV